MTRPDTYLPTPPQDRLSHAQRRSQERVLLITSLSHFRNVALDDDGRGIVDKHMLLVLANEVRVRLRVRVKVTVRVRVRDSQPVSC